MRVWLIVMLWMPDLHDLISRFEDEHTRLMPIDRLGPSCWITPQLDRLKQSIQEEGLQYPLLVWGPVPRGRVKINRGRWNWPTRKDGDFWMVSVGNQRLRAAAELGYTMISCSVYRRKYEAEKRRIHRQMRDYRAWRQSPSATS